MMRGLRSTIALAAVLVVLGAWIYFVTWKKPAETASKQEKVFSGVEADKLAELKITSDKGDVTTLKKDGGTWQLVAPIAAKADQSEVSSIASALGQIEIARVIDENPTDLKEYGLATPRVEVDFKGPSDQQYRRLLLGDKSPTGSDLFAQRNGDKKVFVVPAYQETTLNKSTFDLRDKTILKFERDKVDSIDIKGGEKPIQLVRENTEWKIAEPLQVRADYGAVEGLLGKLQSAAMKSIVTEVAVPADLKKYGLDKPTASVDLRMGSATATLVLGGKAPDNTTYARDASQNTVVTIDSTLADDLKKAAGDYRRKDVFEFRSYNASRVEFTRGGQTVVFEKVKGEAKDALDKWRRVSPNPADADKDKMESLLNRMSTHRRRLG